MYILSHVDVPAVFAECGFLSNPEEAEKLCDENYQKKLAAAIADGIIAFAKRNNSLQNICSVVK